VRAYDDAASQAMSKNVLSLDGHLGAGRPGAQHADFAASAAVATLGRGAWDGMLCASLWPRNDYKNSRTAPSVSANSSDGPWKRPDASTLGPGTSISW
jgi:hypothetical protein